MSIMSKKCDIQYNIMIIMQYGHQSNKKKIQNVIIYHNDCNDGNYIIISANNDYVYDT